MSSTFSHTTRSLVVDGSRRWTLRSFLCIVILLAWMAWFFFSDVPVYRVTDTAGIEVISLPHQVTPMVAGQVVNTAVTLGSSVESGDLLMELDHHLEQLALQKAESRADELRRRLDAFDKEIEAEKVAAKAFEDTTPVVLEEIVARVAEAEANAEYAEENARVQRKLFEVRATSKDDVLEAESRSRASRAAVTALEVSKQRVAEERNVSERDRQTRIATLEREKAEVSVELATEEATARQLQEEIDLHRVRAPRSGRLGQIRQFPTGSFVRAGETVAYIIPRAEQRGVGYFPVAAAGRIRPGQQAWLRLEGYPWMQYGKVPATVVSVASEALEGRIRVEFSVATDVKPFPVPLEHGLPATAEVLVENVSPATLALRTAGWFVSKGSPARIGRDR